MVIFLHRRRKSGAVILVFLAAVLSGLVSLRGLRTDAPATSRGGGLVVSRVIDGDTVVLSDGRVVRYAAIDTPEMGEPYYKEARARNSFLVANRVVELEFDLERSDGKRTLAYVFVGGPQRRIFVNGVLVREGLARVYLHPPNYRYAQALIALQKEARRAKRGIWSRYRPTRPIIGNARTLTYHRPNCPFTRRTSRRNRVFFSNSDGALDRGFHPCRSCRP